MSVTRMNAHWSSWRKKLRNTVMVLGCVAVSTSFSYAEALLPADFFDSHQISNTSQMLVTADFLTVDNLTSIVTARGGVQMSTEGYLVSADNAVYDQKTGNVKLVGSVAVKDSEGQLYTADEADLKGGFREGFLKSLVFETQEGMRISAIDAELRPGKTMLLDNASLTPCGNCVDEKGRTVGWRINAAKVVRDTGDKMIYFTHGSLEIVGIPIAYLPWIAIPDPSLTDFEDVVTTRISYSEDKGYAIAYPGFLWYNSDLGLATSATVYSRQGVLGSANWKKQFGTGAYEVNAWGIYQFSPDAFAGKLGDRNLRGAAQFKTDHEFKNGWKAGGQFTTFSDRSFMTDYSRGAREGSFAVQRVYANKLDDDISIDARIEYYTGIGESGSANESKQGHLLPQVEAHYVAELPTGSGQLVFDTKVLHLQRSVDSSSSVGGTDYVDGYAGTKSHLMAQVAWQDQYTLPAGILVAPYLGVRGDFAEYSNTSSIGSAPASTVAYSATPIAALDVSWPLVASTDGLTHYFTPRLQAVSRGGSASTGITNDDAQSFVFDDSNLFSLNRFSGSDRQDTGTRVAYGFNYHADFEDGRWIDLTIGQSFHLGGTNAAGLSNSSQTGTGSGADAAASHIVLSAKGQPLDTITVGAKALIDPTDASIDRAAIATSYSSELFSAGVDYAFQSSDMAPGVTADRHEIGGSINVPVHDYWSVGADARFDLIAKELRTYGVNLNYDDNYTAATVYYRSTGPDGFEDDRIGAKLNLKMLADVGYDHDL